MAQGVVKSGQCLGWRGYHPMHFAPPPCLRSRPTWQCQATEPAASGSQSQDSNSREPPLTPEEIEKQTAAVLPKSGYFSLADPNQEVYSKAGERFDPNKKGGRYKPEFIWNTNWQQTLEMQESLERKRDAAVAAQKAASKPGQLKVPTTPQRGALSLSRLADLDRMDVDLSDMLKVRPQDAATTSDSAAAMPPPPSAQNGRGGPSAASRRAAELAQLRGVPLPRNDIKRLERSNRITRQMNTTVVSTKPEDAAAKAELAAAELARYEQEKIEQRVWTAGFSLVGAASTYALYGREICISYVVGALGGYVYLRLLGRSVDGYGGNGAVTAVVGNQRLLIPIILALGFNRWNTLYADDFGLQLNLLAILVGFFSYKLALVTRQGKQVLDDISAKKDT